MSKATAFNARWWDGDTLSGKMKVSFAYESTDYPDSIVLRNSDNLAVAIDKESLLEITRMVYPHFIVLPDNVTVNPDNIITTSRKVPYITEMPEIPEQAPEQHIVQPLYKVEGLIPAAQTHNAQSGAQKKRRQFSVDRSAPNAARPWTTKDVEFAISQYKALGHYINELGGKEMWYEVTAKALGRSRKAIRALHYRLLKEGRL